VNFLSRIALLGVFCPLIAAQSGQTAATNPTMRDGGVTETLQSIYIPPLVNAPFTAIVHTEWTRPLGDGGTYTVINQREVARDRNGRIFEERWLLVPKDGRFKSQKNVIQIADPNEHTLYNCFLLQHPQRCYLQAFAEQAQTTPHPAIGQTGSLPDNSGFTTHEELVGRDIENIETQGFPRHHNAQRRRLRQRPAHGHHSRVLVRRQDRRQSSLYRQWSPHRQADLHS
jgi:hypothetical protein